MYTAEEVKEGNKLIAEFMGRPVLFPETSMRTGKITERMKVPYYHSNWIELMPVVEKIEAIEPYWIKIAENNCIVMNHLETLLEVDSSSKIDAVWKACVRFINYINQNNGK